MGRGVASAPRRSRAGFGSLARLILDTAVLIDAERGVSALADVVEDNDDVAIAAITVGELKVGIELAQGERRRRREAFVEAVLGAVYIESYDVEVAEAHAALLADSRRRGRLRRPHDLIIAATARTRRRAVVSADRSAFDDLPDVLVR